MPKKDKQEQKPLDLRIEKEVKNKYNENYEKTLDTIHAMAVFTVKNFGRMGYQIKVLEQILEELKKLNKGK